MQRIKVRIVCFLAMLLLFIPAMAWGLYTPAISEGTGVLTLRNVDDLGWIVGGEYGILDNLAIIADLGEDDYSRAGVKILLNPEIAFLGGFYDSDLFLGVNYGRYFADNFAGVAELDIYKSDGEVMADYEVGCVFNLNEQLDLRGGLMGTIDDTDIEYNLILGVGYRF